MRQAMLRTMLFGLLIGALGAPPVMAGYSDPARDALLIIQPDPAPVGQPFTGELRLRANLGAMGFVTFGPVSQHRIVGDTIEFYFDLGCGWICQTPTVGTIGRPLALPALRQGLKTVRVLDGLGPAVLGEFVIPVGVPAPAGGPAPVSLPSGGTAPAAFLVVLLVTAAAMRRRRRLD